MDALVKRAIEQARANLRTQFEAVIKGRVPAEAALIEVATIESTDVKFNPDEEA